MTPTRTERLTSCPLCGRRESRTICAARDRQHGQDREQFAYARCGGCGVVYQSCRPAEDRIATFYPDDYGPYQARPVVVRADGGAPPQRPHFTLPAFARARLRRWLLSAAERVNGVVRRRYPDPLPAALDRVYTPPRPGATLLDFGCGSADFLDRARARGWRTIGADFVEPVVNAVRDAGHDALLCSAAMWDAIPDKSLDVVRMNHVLEHLYHPREDLARLQSKLRTGGQLHLATPNSASLTFRLLGPRWFPLECPRHILIYTPRTAGRLLRAAGFARTTCFQEVLTKDTARSLGYLLQDLGRLDRAGALAMPNRQALASLLFAPMRLAARAGAADRFHAIAVA